MQIPTHPQTPELALARAMLAALADARPGLAAVPAIEALALLDSVHPPYPPVGAPPAHHLVDEQTTVDALRSAMRTSTEATEIARLVQALCALKNPIILPDTE